MPDKSESNLRKNESSDLSIESKADSHDDRFKIVAIGASAGGLEAFTQLLSNLPDDTGMGFVLIQHLSPQYDSQLSEILQHSTKIPVSEAREGMEILPNAVYVIPPNTLMTLENGILRLESRELVKGKYMAIDAFFSSLATDRGHQAIGVILSGNNEDGTAGLGTIKSAGGITFAQELGTAEFPTMPMIAIASGYVDFVLPPIEIARELVNLSEDKFESNDSSNVTNTFYELNDQSAAIFTETVESVQALTTILGMLHNRMGVDFTHYKQGTIRRRISRRMGLLNMQTLEDYANYLQEHPLEVEKLYHDILINVTSFFREPESFSALRQTVFPEICQNKSLDLPIRIWVVGCASGEEVYSIAITLLEFFDNLPKKHPIQIFATDISLVAIEKARAGIYSHNSVINISPERLRRFFIPVEGGYQIGKLVRNLCVFAKQDLISDPPFSRLDLISCRNMLIYLEPVLQKKVMPIFHYALNPNGFLMLGGSEGVSHADDLFAIADKKNRIYKSKFTSSKMNYNFATSSHLRTQKNESSSLTKYREPTSENYLERLADQTVLSRYAPVGVMVDEDLEILQFRGQTSAYLKPAPGKASLNLLKMAHPSLRLELRSLISRVKQQDIPVSRDEIEMEGGVIVKIDVIPLALTEIRYFLVLFESRPHQRLLAPAQSGQIAQSPKDGARDIEMARLTHELAKTKEYLRSIIEAQEENNQDLKVAGEEILSSNEELQSANEELETAKEEIQATNEELSTINDELRSGNTQLNQVNNDMQNLLTSVNIPILMLSGDLRIRRFTPTAEQAFNLIASDVGRPFSDIKNKLDVPNIQSLITSVINTLIPYEQNIQDVNGDWHSLRIRPYRTTDNRIDGVVITLIDINLLQRNTIALEASRNYATAIIETLHQPLIVLNNQMEVVTANHAFYTVFQANSHQTERESLFALNQRAWDTPKLRSLLNEILLMDITVQDYEITQDFPQIGTRTMLLNACQIEQPNSGQMILIAIEDITERNYQKRQLTVQNQELSDAMITSEAANIAKSEFLGSMSHELRTPLNAIMGFVQILQDSETLDPESLQYLEIIYQSADYLLSLIQDLLDITRIEAEKMQIEPNFLVLVNFLDITVSMVSAKAIAKNLSLTTQFAADLPETIYADEKRLRQILLNLLSNAIKFTDTGEIALAVSKVQSIDQAGKSCESIRFTVTDTGSGIATADIEKIFLPFEQVGDAKIKHQGAGLGLAISQNLIQQMGSEIKVISSLGVGSTFSFELALISPQDQIEDQSLIMLEEVRPAIAPSSSLQIQTDRLLAPASPEQISLDQTSIVNKVKLASTLPLTILVAENYQHNQMFIQKLLQRLGYEPDSVSNGLEVLAHLREKTYDVVLIDIQIPEMDGITITKTILAEYAQAARPYIIAMTSAATKKERAKCLAAGMNAYISKPINFSQLEKALLQACFHKSK